MSDTLLTPDLLGKTCLVTGGTGGLGLETAVQLAQKGASVIIAGRSDERLQAAQKTIQAASQNGTVETLRGDLSAQADVRRIAAEFSAAHPTLDVLVNNVGANNMRFGLSPDGIERTWALNYLNHFLLTNLLLPNLNRAAEQNGEARILEISSSIYRLVCSRFDRVQGQNPYNGVRAYAQSKRAMLVFVSELTRRLEGTGITANAISPGVVRTNIAMDNPAIYRWIMRLLDRFALPLDAGTRPIVHLCVSPEFCQVSGAFFYKFERRPLSADITSPETGRELWEISSRATGIGIEVPERIAVT